MPGTEGQGKATAMSTAAADDDIMAAVAARVQGSGHAAGQAMERDAESDSSSQSDEEEEAAGLVSRLSDDEERDERRARYASTLGGGKKPARRPMMDDEEGFEDEDSKDLEARTQSKRTLFDAGATHDEPSASEVMDSDELATPGNANGYAPPGAHGQRPLLARQGIGRRAWIIAREALPTLLISVISLVCSGELLVRLAKWPVFTRVDKLFILIPILLNLKGNLEGNLSLRMSTSANIGELDLQRTRETLIFGNLALLQVQALIVSLFAGVLSYLLGIGSSPLPPKPNQTGSSNADAAAPAKRMALTGSFMRSTRQATSQGTRLAPRRVIHKPKIDPSVKLHNTYFEFVLVIATAMLSASVSSAILGSFMCALVVMTRQHGINPDNIASPLAGSLGDLLTLSILGLLATFLVRFEGTILATLILVGLAAACAMCFVVSYRNAYVRELLSSGWVPLLIAMLISSGAGVVLDSFVQRFEGFALLAPVLAGVPGACAAIFVSRTSTALHAGVSPKASGASSNRNTTRSWLVHDEEKWYQKHIFRHLRDMPGPLEGWLVPCVLGIIGVLILFVFVTFIRLTGQMTFGIPFAVAFTVFAIVTIGFALCISHCLCIALWRADYDPDIYSLPFVTSSIDVVAQLLLVSAFFVAQVLGDKITASVNDPIR